MHGKDSAGVGSQHVLARVVWRDTPPRDALETLRLPRDESVQRPDTTLRVQASDIQVGTHGHQAFEDTKAIGGAVILAMAFGCHCAPRENRELHAPEGGPDHCLRETCNNR